MASRLYAAWKRRPLLYFSNLELIDISFPKIDNRITKSKQLAIDAVLLSPSVRNRTEDTRAMNASAEPFASKGEALSAPCDECAIMPPVAHSNR